MVELAPICLSNYLAEAKNVCVQQSIFPFIAKVGSVVHLDKERPNENEISKFRSVTILNTFLKICEVVIKNYIII